MNGQIKKIQQAIAPYKKELIDHPLYKELQTAEDLRIFMEHHIYAVWDFMSLLKYLQIQLTWTHIPWIPVGSGNTRFLINEIVTGEESDTDEEGNRTSQFELYLKAMDKAGANTSLIKKLLQSLREGEPLDLAILNSAIPESARAFMQFTFSIIKSGQTHAVAAAFTFGREDLIPDIFTEIVKDINQNSDVDLSSFIYYLERHIEVDGGHHSNLALKMVEELCENDPVKWEEVEKIAISSLQARIDLWNGIYRNVSKETV
jgi:hypothetical protein